MQKILSIILTAVLMITTLGGLIGEKYDVYENIRYGDAERNLVTVYVPKSAYTNEINGCILILHGGSWQGGEKEDMAPFCKKIAMNGYISATMSYSLINDENRGQVTAFTMLDEIDQCINAIGAFSEEHTLNISHMATFGYSAGGHLSMLYSYSRPEDASIPLAFTANRVGPSDFSADAWPGNTGLALTSQLTGIEITQEMIDSGEADRLVASISPVAFVNDDTLPSIFAYAGNDPLVAKGNRLSMEKVFSEHNSTYDYIYYPLSGHGLLLDPLCDIKFFNVLFEYCETYFGY